jgi:hypothetical protein
MPYPGEELLGCPTTLSGGHHEPPPSSEVVGAGVLPRQGLLGPVLIVERPAERGEVPGRAGAGAQSREPVGSAIDDHQISPLHEGCVTGDGE